MGIPNNGEDHGDSIGDSPLLGWLVAYVIAAGIVILLLHLTLYPYPDITRIINPKG